MRKLFFLSLAAIVITTVGCKKKVGENVDLDYLVDGDIEVTKNPNGNAPLTAIAKINSKEAINVTMTVEGDHPLIYQISDFREDPEVQIFGLYPDQTNTITLRLEDEDENWTETTLNIDAPAVPSALPVPEVTTKQEGLMANGFTLCGVNRGTNTAFVTSPILVDKDGIIRWYLDLTSNGAISFPIRVMDDGTFWYGFQDNIYQMNWVGKELHHFTTPGYWQHHELQFMPNGNLLLAVDKLSLNTVEDYILEVDKSGNIVREWDMREILDMDRHDLVNDSVDWFHMNAVFYDENEDALIISGRNQGVVKVDMENNLQWILAPHKGWGKAGLNGNGHETSDFLLTAVDANGDAYAPNIQDGDDPANDFEWTWGQHAPMILPNGNIFIYDNGFNRNFSQNQQYSRAVEYKIDEQNMEIEQVWQYGKARGSELYSIIISDVDLLENDNRLMTSGIMFDQTDPNSKVVELQYPSKTVVYELVLHLQNEDCDGSFSWGGTDITYRAERVDFSDMTF